MLHQVSPGEALGMSWSPQRVFKHYRTPNNKHRSEERTKTRIPYSPNFPVSTRSSSGPPKVRCGDGTGLFGPDAGNADGAYHCLNLPLHHAGLGETAAEAGPFGIRADQADVGESIHPQSPADQIKIQGVRMGHHQNHALIG